MKGYYIVYEDIEDKRFPGVNIKIKSQIHAMREAGIEVKPLLYQVHNTTSAKVLYRLPFVNAEPRWKYDHRIDRVDFIYMRKPYINRPYISFLKKVKRFSKAKIIVEFPTYPYDGELKERVIDYPLYIKDLLARKHMKECVDRIANLTDEKLIYGVRTLQIINGFDFDKFHLHQVNRNDDELRLCCIARFMPWHGYERLLEGLANYYHKGASCFLH